VENKNKENETIVEELNQKLVQVHWDSSDFFKTKTRGEREMKGGRERWGREKERVRRKE
jgi:hypothetical protein